MGLWTMCIVGASTTFCNILITSWYQNIVTALYLVTTISAYTKMFLSLRRNQIRVQNHVAQGSRFVEDGNKRQQLSFSLPEL